MKETIGKIILFSILLAGFIICFTSTYYLYYLPKENAAYNRIELICTIINMTLYGGTCSETQQKCTRYSYRDNYCHDVKVTVDCERVDIVYEFIINDTIKTDHRDLEYDNQKINNTDTCYWDGSLSFATINQVLTIPRLVTTVVGIILSILTITIILEVLGFFKGEEKKEKREEKNSKVIEIIERKDITII